MVTDLREEVARLKGLNRRPTIKPSGMEAGDPAKPVDRRVKRWRGKVVPKVAVEDQVVKVEVPADPDFKGYEDYLVQDLVVQARVIRYRRERWVTPNGKTVVAPLPGGINGHFGPELKRFIQHEEVSA